MQVLEEARAATVAIWDMAAQSLLRLAIGKGCNYYCSCRYLQIEARIRLNH